MLTGSHMAKRKAIVNDQPKGRRKPRKKSWLSQLLRMAISTPARQLIMIVIIVVLLAVFRDKIESAFGSLIDLFGWGLVFIAIAIVTLIVMTWRRKLGTLIFHWNRWLGSIALILAIWGILAFLPIGRILGGSFGRDIIAFPAPVLFFS